MLVLYQHIRISIYKNIKMHIRDLCHLLSDETRLRCLTLVYAHQELCVCELSYALALPQPKISRHLNTMKLHGLVSQRREGQWIFYSIQTNLSDFEQKLLALIVNQLQSQTQFTQDNKRLIDMADRPHCPQEVN